MNTRKVGGSAVIGALISRDAGIGLFIIQPDRPDPYYKIAGGEVYDGEPIHAALVREMEEETGYTIPSRREGTALILGDESCKVTALGSRSIKGYGGVPHTQYFFVIDVKDPREIIALDRQDRKEDDEELIRTQVFNLPDVAGVPNFHPKQRPLLQQLFDYTNKERV